MGRKKNIDTIKTLIENLKSWIDGLKESDPQNYDLLDKWEDEVEALTWALRKLEAEEIGIGDRVRLYVYPDEPSEQPEQGEVIGYSGGGYLVRPFTGEYSGTKNGLWYGADQVWLVDE